MFNFKTLLIAAFLSVTAMGQTNMPLVGVGTHTSSGPSFLGSFITYGANSAGSTGSCSSPCTVSLGTTLAVGQTAIVFATSNFLSTFSVTDSGSNTYTTTVSSGYAMARAVNVANSATTITVSSGGGGNVAGAIQLISGATTVDGAAITAPGSTTFASSNITPGANGLSVCDVMTTSSGITPVSFNSPWASVTAIGNTSGWAIDLSSRSTSNGVAFNCSGTTTTNAAPALAVMAVH